MLAGGLERSGQRNAGDPTFRPYPPLTNPPAAGGLFTHTLYEGRTVEILARLPNVYGGKNILNFSIILNKY